MLRCAPGLARAPFARAQPGILRQSTRQFSGGVPPLYGRTAQPLRSRTSWTVAATPSSAPKPVLKNKWGPEEVMLLQQAIENTRQQNGVINYTVLTEEYKRLAPGTPRNMRGIQLKAKQLLAKPAPATTGQQEGGAEAGAERAGEGAAGAGKSKSSRGQPPVTLVQMMGEVMSAMPDMEGTTAQIMAAVGSHPIYCHLLNWGPCTNPRYTYNWQSTMMGNLVTRRVFELQRNLNSEGKRVYRYDPEAKYAYDIWGGLPYVLASLLTTYLPNNEATVEELVQALFHHHLMYKVVLRAGESTDPRSMINTLAITVERMLQSHTDLFEILPENPKGSKAKAVAHAAARYRAVIRPHPVYTQP